MTDLLLTDGPVLLPDGSTRPDWAVAVDAGVISAVGPAHELRARRTSRTEVVDLHGRLALPGFVDAHAHPMWGGLERLACDLLELPRTVPAYQQAVAASARARPEVSWLTGGGWSFEAFPSGVATAQALDAVVADRPVVLFNRGHHSIWVNTRALQLAGLDERTADPADGRVERDAEGRPTGVLHEGALRLVTDLLPTPSDADLEAALDEAQARLLPLGVTGWVEAILGAYSGHPDPLPAYLRAWRSGRLVCATTGALWWDRTRGLEQLDELSDRRAAAAAAGVDVRQVKIMVDGIIENQTAAMLAGYHRDGRATAARGLSFVPRETLLAAVPALQQAGFAVHAHAIGDRAVRDTLDAVDRARVDHGPPAAGPPHQIAHLQVVDAADVPRFAALDVMANCQAVWACHDPQMDRFTIPVLGPQRSVGQYPFGQIAAAGAGLALGSDWPVSSADPWAAVHVAVTRTPVDSGGEPPLLPAQALTVRAALLAATSGSAAAAGLRHVGSLHVGARADLVVASADPFAVPPDELAALHSAVVVAGGRVVAWEGAST